MGALRDAVLGIRFKFQKKKKKKKRKEEHTNKPRIRITVTGMYAKECGSPTLWARETNNWIYQRSYCRIRKYNYHWPR